MSSRKPSQISGHPEFMRHALTLARRAYGETSPNPMVGAVLVKGSKILGQGWHHRAGQPHAEIEALRDAQKQGAPVRGATLYVTLEPCCTHGRTPPCTDAIIAAGIKRVVVAATDPNPAHAGRGFRLLRRAGIEVLTGVLAAEAERLNEAFNHWIVHRTPFVTVKAAMTLDGKIATVTGESKWITGEKARAEGMRLRQGSDAILVGVNTVLADDPSLTVRNVPGFRSRVILESAFQSGAVQHCCGSQTRAPDRASVRRSRLVHLGVPEITFENRSSERTAGPRLRRIILDTHARTPLKSQVVRDSFAHLTTIVVGPEAPATRVKKLAEYVNVLRAPLRRGRIDLRWLLRHLGKENVTSLLVEGGGEVNASFLLGKLAHRVAFFYAPKILGGRDARKAVAGDGASKLNETLTLREVEWRRVGEDLMMTARVDDV